MGSWLRHWSLPCLCPICQDPTINLSTCKNLNHKPSLNHLHPKGPHSKALRRSLNSSGLRDLNSGVQGGGGRGVRGSFCFQKAANLRAKTWTRQYCQSPQVLCALGFWFQGSVLIIRNQITRSSEPSGFLKMLAAVTYLTNSYDTMVEHEE